VRNAPHIGSFFVIAGIFLQFAGAQAEDRPAVNVDAQPKVNLNAFNAALQQRDAAVGKGQLFEDFADWTKANIVLIGLQQQKVALERQRNHLRRGIVHAQAIAPRFPAPLQQLKTQIAVIEKEISNLDNNPQLGKGLTVQQQHVLNLWGKTRPRLQQWLTSYSNLRSLLPMDPKSADFIPIKTLLEAESGRPGAYDIKVLLAILKCLGPQRNAQAAGIELQQLIKDYERYFLVRMDADVRHWDIVGGDLFLACILAGQTQLVAGYADALNELPRNLRTPYRNALVCLYLKFEDRESLLDKALKTAAAEWGLLKGAANATANNFEREVLEMVAGQYAFFHFTCKNQRYRDPLAANRVVNLIAPPCSHWLYDLGKSADNAHQGKWAQAVEVLKECEERCPESVIPVVEKMKLAYAKKEQFVQQ
jgi:hypothetical protein